MYSNQAETEHAVKMIHSFIRYEIGFCIFLFAVILFGLYLVFIRKNPRQKNFEYKILTRQDALLYLRTGWPVMIIADEEHVLLTPKSTLQPYLAEIMLGQAESSMTEPFQYRGVIESEEKA